MKHAHPLTVIALAFSLNFAQADAPVTELATPPASAEPKTFDVRTMGAKGDGKTLDTEAIQSALTECGKAGGGTVRIPAGTYLSQPLTLGTKTTLVLEEGATLLASPDHKHFMKNPGDWLAAKSSGEFINFLSGKDLTDITITGKGVIDGNGGVWWEEAEKARQKVSGYTLPRPNLIVLTRCNNVKMSGITLQNSPKFHFVPTDCDGVTIEGVTVLAPERAANTDALDPSDCRNVLITRCRIDVGDDNIAIKAGKKKLEGREWNSENITVTDCLFQHGHGLSVGSECVGGLRGLTVKNCRFENTDNGIRLKSRRGLGGTLQDLTYTDITMTNVHPAISIACYYQDSSQAKFPTNDVAQPMTNTTPIFHNITIKNVTAYSTREAGLIAGLPESPVENVTLENVTITAKQGLTFANVKGVTLKNVKVTAEQGEPYILFNAEVAGLPEAAKKP